jgi:hypothetical protein
VDKLQCIDENHGSVASRSDALSSDYVLTSDIDASGTSSWNSGNGFDSIGEYSSKFTGAFDGANHTISGLYMDRSGTEYMGTFGWVGSGGTIENVGVINADITAGEFVGALVGRNEGTVKRSNSSGTVHVVGGGGHVKRKAGGLVGVNGGTITNSNSSADATSDNTYAGGLVGDNFGTIKKSYATGNPTASGDIAGGLAGSNSGTIKNSYATGDVSADSEAGGLAGSNSGFQAEITDSYATGDVSAESGAGGLVGFNDASLKYSYWDNGTTNQGSAVGDSGFSGSTTDLTGFGSTGDSSPAPAMQRFAPQVTMDTFDYSSTWNVTSGYPALQWEGVTALTVDSVDATDPTVSEDESGSIAVTAKEGGTDAGEGVTIEVLDDDGLDGFATSDTKTTDANGEVTFTFDEPTAGTYSPEFACADDTSVSHSPTVTVQNAPEVSSIVRKSGESNPTNAEQVTFTVTFTESVSGVDSSDFTITDTAGGTASVASVTEEDANNDGDDVWEVQVGSLSGDGDVRLDLDDDDSITSDSTSVKLGGVGTSGGTGDGSYSSGESFTVDNTAVTLDSAAKSDTTTIDVELSDGGGGIDKSSISSGDFSLSTGSIASIDKTGVTDGGTGTQTVSISLSSAVDTDTVTVSLQSDGIDDTAGNTQTSGSADATGMDGIAPTLDAATKSDDTTIDVDLSDGGTGIDKSSISKTDFSTSAGSIASIDTSSVTDGGTGTQTVTISLTSAVDADTVTVSLQSDGIDDLAGNTVTAGSADASNMDGVAPSITDSTLASDNSYVDVTFSEGVYESDGSSALTAAALSATMTQNGGTVSSASVSSVTKIDGTSLAGGETTVRVHLSLSGGPADGVETVQIGPADDSSVGDDDTNLLASADTTSSITLTDRSGPALTADTGSTDEDTSAELVADLLGNDNDASTPLSVTQVDGSAGTVGTATDGSNGGEFTITSDGTVDFDPSGEFDSLGGGDTDTTQVSVTVEDAVGNTNTQTVTATVQGVNDAPTDIALTSTTVAQSAGANAVVGSLSVSDVDDSSHTFSLVSGTGDADNGAFSIDGSDLVADDAATLAEGTDSVRIEAADGDGGTYQNAFSISVTDDMAPTITATSPADDATGVLESSNITITFSEDIAFGTGEITLREADGGFSDRAAFDVGSDTGSGDGTVSISGPTLRIDPSTELAGMTTYAVQIDAGALTDRATSSNDFAGIGDDTTLNFTTTDSTSPTASVGADSTVIVGESVTFDASGSIDDVSIVSYEWDFDDGSTATGKTTTHQFASSGTYDVELTVTDAGSNEATAARTITAEKRGGNNIELEPVPETGDDETTESNDTDPPSAGGSEEVSSIPSTDGSANFSVSDPDGEGPIVIDIGGPGPGESGIAPEEVTSPEEPAAPTTNASGGTQNRGDGDGAPVTDNVAVDSLSITPTETGQREFDLSVREWEVDTTTLLGPETDRTGETQEADRTVTRKAESTSSRTDPRAFLQATGASPVGYVEVNHTNPDTHIDTVTFRFRIRKTHLQDTGVTPEAVSLYRDESDLWARLSTDQVAETDTHYVFEATSPGLSLFTIGSTQPVFQVETANSQPITLGVSEQVTVDATVRNIGGAAGTYTAELRANGSVVTTTTAELAPNATREISLSFRPKTPGDYTLSVGSVHAGTISVRSENTAKESTPKAAEPPTALFAVTTALATILALFVLARWRP